MNFKKYSIFTSILTLFILGCAFRTIAINEKDSLIGTYRYLKDSIPNANNKFFEEVEIKSDGSFTYKNRIGSFIRTEVRGNWKLEGNSLILDSPSSFKDLIETIDCPSDINKDLGCYLKVRNQKGQKISYMLIVNGDEKNIIKEQYDNSYIKDVTMFENLQVITTSGLYSKVLDLPSNVDEKKCYQAIVSETKSFNNEEWLFTKGKINPRGFNGKYTEYYLYKVSNLPN